MNRPLGSLRSILVVGIAVPLLALGFSPVALAHASSGGAGATRWVARYNGPGNGEDVGLSVGVSPDGKKLFVTGQSAGASLDSDYATVAYDASTGAKLWAKRYGGSGGGDDGATALEVSVDGNTVFVTGWALQSGGTADYVTIAYDASAGAARWVARYNGPGNQNDEAFAIALSPDGTRVFVTGHSVGLHGDLDYATIAYDAPTGNRLWTKRYAGPGNTYDSAVALEVSPDGSEVFVTGTSGSDTAADYVTIAYDESIGTSRWVERYDGPGRGMDEVAALAVSPSGSEVFVTGQSFGSDSDFDYATIAYEGATGAMRWVKRYNGPANGYDAARSVDVTPAGTMVFVTGGSTGVEDISALATVAYDASTGTTQWVAKRYNAPANTGSEGNSLAVTPDGAQLVVTGDAGRGGPGDYATLDYDASSGALRWLRRYDGPGNSADIPWSIALSPDGRTAFVTGASIGLGSSYDYATIAYRTG